jgi:hypothetical protein
MAFVTMVSMVLGVVHVISDLPATNVIAVMNATNQSPLAKKQLVICVKPVTSEKNATNVTLVIRAKNATSVMMVGTLGNILQIFFHSQFQTTMIDTFATNVCRITGGIIVKLVHGETTFHIYY